MSINLDQYQILAPVIASNLINAMINMKILNKQLNREMDEKEIYNRVMEAWFEMVQKIEDASSKLHDQTDDK